MVRPNFPIIFAVKARMYNIKMKEQAENTMIRHISTFDKLCCDINSDKPQPKSVAVQINAKLKSPTAELHARYKLMSKRIAGRSPFLACPPDLTSVFKSISCIILFRSAFPAVSADECKFTKCVMSIVSDKRVPRSMRLWSRPGRLPIQFRFRSTSARCRKAGRFCSSGPAALNQIAGKSGEWNRGAYLSLGLSHCGACHTPRNMLGAEKAGDAYAGAVIDNWIAPPLTAANPAPAPWTREEIYSYLRMGMSRSAWDCGRADVSRRARAFRAARMRTSRRSQAISPTSTMPANALPRSIRR